MSCAIVMDNNFDCVYRPGNVISGKVVFTLTAEDTITDIIVELVGQEETKWTKGLINSDVDANTEWKGCNTFLTMKQPLSEEGDEDFSVGNYEFPFKFELPENIPSTYACATGGIKFYIKATIDNSTPLSYRALKDITVKSPMYVEDLDAEWLAKHHEAAMKITNQLGCLITLDVYMQRRALAQGKKTTVKVDVTNNSKDDIWRVELVITQTIESKVTTPKEDTKTETKTLLYERQGGVDAGTKRSYEFLLKIPPSVVIPKFNFCQLFSQKCYMKVVAVAMTYEVETSTCIIIGDHNPDIDEVDDVISSHTSLCAPAGTHSSLSSYNPISSSPSFVPRYRSPSHISTSLTNELYSSANDLGYPPPSYDLIYREAMKKKNSLPYSPHQTPPSALPSSFTPYPPVLVPSSYVPYPTCNTFPETRSVMRNIRASVAPVADSDRNIASASGTQSLYPPPLDPVNVCPPMPTSSIIPSMPLPDSSLYPPKRQGKIAPYPIEDPLVEWDQLLDALKNPTDIPTSSSSIVPKESRIGSDDNEALETQRESSYLPSEVLYPPPVDIPKEDLAESEEDVASKNKTQPVSSTFNPLLNEGLHPPPMDTVRPPVGSHGTALFPGLNSPLLVPSDELYPPPTEAVRQIGFLPFCTSGSTTSDPVPTVQEDADSAALEDSSSCSKDTVMASSTEATS